MNTSLVYSHIWAYRAVMSVLYGGQYRRRFRDIVECVGDQAKSVVELCFGDIYIARWCRSRGVVWTGVDLNAHFCRIARRQGYQAIHGNIGEVDLPRADVVIIAGSLYHFHDQLDPLFDRILARTDRLIVSEPVRNLSSSRGWIGHVARRSANPGNGQAVFRFDESSLVSAVESQARRMGLKYRVVSVKRDMLLEIYR